MTKLSPARYRTTSWSSYNAALRKRGSLLIWLDKDMAWLAPHDGRPGRPAVFSDAAIQFCLTIKVLFKLPLRQTTGMVASLLRMANLEWAMPDYSTLCRKQRTLAVQIPYRRSEGPLNLLVDSTGIKFLGDGEWQVRKHGVQGRRQWCKVHPAMDTATSDIRAVEFTPSREGDSPVLSELLDQSPEAEQIGTVTADGAYDTRRCMPQSSRAKPLPSSRSARTDACGQKTVRQHEPETKPCAPHGTMAGRSGNAGPDTTQEAGAKPRCPRRFARTGGTHRLDLKAFGERISARDPDRQTAEIQIRIALGTAEIIRVA